MNTKIKVAVLIVENEMVLLLKEKLEKSDIFLWNVVKGSLEVGETIFEAARRECLEEASVAVELTSSLGTYISESEETRRVQFNFVGKITDGSPEIVSPQDQELRGESIQELRWHTKEEVGDMKVESFVSNRTFELLQDWLSEKKHPISNIKYVDL